MLFLLAVAAVVIFGGGALAIARLTRQPAGVDRLLAAPPLRIADAEDAADVRIEGTVEVLDGTLPAPVSGIGCVYFEVEVVEIARGSGLASTIDGVIVRREAGGVPFIVRDSSGYAIVDPHGVTALLALRPEVGAGHGRLVRREKRIVPGETIVVIGRGVREPDPDPAKVGGLYREGPPMRLRLTTSAQFPLHLLDDAADSAGGR